MKFLKIGAHHYPVVTNSVHLSEDGIWGEHDSRNRVLHIEERERPDSAVVEDLVHEILHACFMDAGRDDVDDNIEEKVVTLLAPRITAFLEDNYPKAITELAKVLR